MPAPKRILLLGATGSIGDSTLRVLRAHPDRFTLVGASAHGNAEKLAAIAREFTPEALALCGDGEITPPAGIACYRGAEAALALLDHPCDLVVAATSGAAGLRPVMKALSLGRNVALANKEALVCAGALMLEEAARTGARILPVDSEHNAIFQCLTNSASLSHITLTASGGPFLHTPLSELPHVTPEQAVAHPKWSMGAKISVDSASMMNKALEMIEAHWLFALPPDKIEVIIHPQAILHGAAHFSDGSTLAQMSAPDMATPLSYCLFWPERSPLAYTPFSWSTCETLRFFPVDEARFAAPALARRAMASGQAACIALNAANEVAVSAFLARRLRFTDIVPMVERMSEYFSTTQITGIADVLALDSKVRTRTESLLTERLRHD